MKSKHRSGIYQIFWQIMKGIPQYVFPTTFPSPPSAPLSQDLSLAKTHGAGFRTYEAQALMSHFQNSVRDTAIGKRWICLDSERSTLHRVWAITKVSVVAMELVWLVFFFELGDFIC